jgi:hypothetical protein
MGTLRELRDSAEEQVLAPRREKQDPYKARKDAENYCREIEVLLS